MNLLLLLSALLSALTGIGGTRGAPVAQAVCERSVEVHAARAAVAMVVTRPIQALPTSRDIRPGAGVAFLLTAVEPIYASRRRE